MKLLHPPVLRLNALVCAVFLLAPISTRAASADALDFIVQTADGTSVTGPLQVLDDTWSVRLGGASEAHVDGPDVLSIRRAERALPVFPLEEQVILANGDRLVGSVIGMSGERLRWHAFFGQDQEVELPLSALAVIWMAAPTGVHEPRLLLRRLLASARRRDRVLLRNGDVVEGILTGLDRKRVAIEVDRKEVEISLPKVAAIALNTELAHLPSPKKPHGHLLLDNGSRLTVVAASADEAELRGKTIFGAEIKVSLGNVMALDMRQGRAVYLSDLKPRAYDFMPYSGSIRWPYVLDGSAAGDDLTLAGSTYDKGLGMHSASRLTYDLEGRYQSFEALVGLDERSGRQGSARIKVLVDGKVQELGWNGELSERDGPQAVRIKVAGAHELILVVEFGRRGDVRGHVNWADARLIH